MKAPPVVLIVTLLSLDLLACGGTGHDASSTSRAASGAVRTGSASTATTQTTAKDTGPTFARGSYETSGVAASEPDKRAIAAVVERYYAAAAADNGAEACSLLYRPLEKSVAEDYGNEASLPEIRGKTCAVVMSKLFKHRHGEPTSDITGMEVTGARINRETTGAIALLRSPTMPVGETTVHLERGIWRVDQLLGSPLH